MNDQGDDIWIPEIRQDRVELVNVDTGERQYEPDVAVLVPAVLVGRETALRAA